MSSTNSPSGVRAFALRRNTDVSTSSPVTPNTSQGGNTTSSTSSTPNSPQQPSSPVVSSNRMSMDSTSGDSFSRHSQTLSASEFLANTSLIIGAPHTSSLPYKEFEAQNQSSVKQQQGQKEKLDLLTMPEDCVQVVRESKTIPTGMKVVPDNVNLSGTNGVMLDQIHMLESFKVFTAPTMKLEHAYKTYKKIKSDEEKFSSQKFEIDAENKSKKEKEKEAESKDKKSPDTTEEKVELNFDILKSNPGATSKTIQKKLAGKLCKVYDMATQSSEFEWNGGVEQTICKRMPAEKKFDLKVKDPFLIEVLKFETKFGSKFGEMEPLFLEMALFDLKTKKRVSENFYVDCNTPEIYQDFPLPKSPDTANQLKSAVFHCSNRSNEIYLFIKLFKVLSGDEDDATAQYTDLKTAEKLKEADFKKMKKSAQDICSKLGEYKQPVAWTAVPVFNDNEELAIPNTPITQWYRTKGNVPDYALLTMFGTETGKKIKPIPISIHLQTVELDDFQPEYKDKDIVLLSGLDEKNSQATKLAKDIREFPIDEVLDFNTKYENVLYIYPDHVNFAKAATKSSRNIAIKVQVKGDDSNLDDEGLPCIFGKSSEPFLTTSAFTKVSYHNRHPEFNDEIKIKLPAVITPQHHLLFTFLHVHCKENKGNKPTYTLVGYATLPLLVEGTMNRLNTGKKSCGVIFEYSQKSSYQSAEVKRASKYHDYGKQLFDVNLKFISTIYSEDPKLAAFFQTIPSLYTVSSASSDLDAQLSKDLNGLIETPSNLIIQNLPVLFNYLLRIICTPSLKQASVAAFKTLLKCMDSVTSAWDVANRSSHSAEQGNRNIILGRYVEEVFNNFKDTESIVYRELATQWLHVLEEISKKRKGSGRHAMENAELKHPLNYSYILFDLIYKSMVLHLDQRNILYKTNRTDPERFDESFCSLLQRLIETMADEVVYRSGIGLSLAKVLNQNLALFLKDLLNVMDRGYVLYLVDIYLKSIHIDLRNYEVLQELRILFLKIIIDCEHFVALCNPAPLAVEKYNDMDKTIKEHFLAGILMEQIKADLTNKERTVRGRCFEILRYILTKVEYDSRYQTDSVKEMISNRFFPFVIYLSEVFDEFRNASEEKMLKLRKNEENLRKELTEAEGKYNQFREESDLVTQGNSPANDMESQLQKELDDLKKKHQEAQRQYLVEAKRVKTEEQNALLCFLFIIKTMSRELLLQWISREFHSRIGSLLKIMHLTIDIFEYEGKEAITERSKLGIETSTSTSLMEAKNALENMYNSLDRRTNLRSNTSTLNKYNSNGGVSSPSASSANMGTAGRKKGTLTRNFKVNRAAFKKNDDTQGDMAGQSKEIIKQIVLWEGNLNTEVSLSLLDVFSDLLHGLEKEWIGTAQKSDRQNDKLFDNMFQLLMSLFSSKQSEKTLESALFVLRDFIQQFRSIIFSKNNSFSEDIIKQLLTKCHCKLEKIRGIATAVLFSVIKSNYLQSNHFMRTKIQTTVALSNVVSTMDDKSIVYLRATFAAIAEYAKKDKDVVAASLSSKPSQVFSNPRDSLKNPFDKLSREDSKDFPSQVQNLVSRLEKALLDSKAIKDLEKTNADSEKMTDLYYRIAQQYRHAPELSVSWYSNLAEFHRKLDHKIEAAQCIGYIAAAVYQYLVLINALDPKVVSNKHLVKVCPLLREEKFEEMKSLFEESGKMDQPLFESHYWTEKGFVSLVKQMIADCNEASYYEYSVELYKMLIEFSEHRRDYDTLSELHTNVAELYGYISKANTKQNRLFGSYYKVAFYGAKWSDDLRNKQFIYKMPRITRLAEIVDYLQQTFIPNYGEEFLKFVGDSFVATEKVKEENLAYIQVTSVRPYFHDERKAHFEVNTDIKQFFFETPFTKSGKSQGGLGEQYKRKTIVSVADHFPGMKTRSEVVQKQETELTPIENAIELLELSINRLELESNRSPPNINNLQMVLSGNVIPQVNEGVGSIVNTFLASPTEKYTDKHVTALKGKLRLFLMYCAKCISVSNKIASNEQQPLQKQFEKGFEALKTLFSKHVDHLQAINVE